MGKAGAKNSLKNKLSVRIYKEGRNTDRHVDRGNHIDPVWINLGSNLIIKQVVVDFDSYDIPVNGYQARKINYTKM